jgi:hypothetical protein
MNTYCSNGEEKGRKKQQKPEEKQIHWMKAPVI